MAPSLLRLLNGERTVVFLYVVRILLSVPLSLLPEAFSLSLISLLALSVEISADAAANPLALFFRTRPGASSGVLLGAVTLPGLLVSKLVQTLRAKSLNEVGIEGSLILSYPNRLRDLLYAAIGWSSYLCLLDGFTAFQRTVKPREYFFANIII